MRCNWDVENDEDIKWRQQSQQQLLGTLLKLLDGRRQLEEREKEQKGQQQEADERGSRGRMHFVWNAGMDVWQGQQRWEQQQRKASVGAGQLVHASGLGPMA